MDFIIWIIFGAVAGFIADLVMASDHGLIEDVILGVIGAFVGGFVMNTFGQPGVTGFNVYSVVVAVIGAIILIFIGRAFRRSAA